MEKEIKYGLKRILDIIPIIAALGVITGYGSHTTIFGALIASVFGLFFNPALVYGITIPMAVSLGTANLYLGGKFETLMALLLMSGVFLILFSFFKKAPKPDFSASYGFFAGCVVCVSILSLPLLFGLQTYSAIPLMLDANFLNVTINDNAFVIALLTLAIYYYASRIKALPSVFLALFGSGLVCMIYNMQLPSVLEGFNGYKIDTYGDFSEFYMILGLGFLLACIVSADFYKSKKTNAGLGLSSITGAFTGFISTGISAESKTKFSALIQVVIFLLFIFLFDKIGGNLPLASVSCILVIKSYELLKKSFKILKRLKNKQKAIWLISFVLCLYDVIFGAIFAISVSLGKKLWETKLKRQ